MRLDDAIALCLAYGNASRTLHATELPLCMWLLFQSCTNKAENCCAGDLIWSARLFWLFLAPLYYFGTNRLLQYLSYIGELFRCLGAKMPLFFKEFKMKLSWIVGAALRFRPQFRCCFPEWLSVATKFDTVLPLPMYEAIAPIDFFSEPLANNWLADKDRQNDPSPDLIVTAQTGRRGQFARIFVSKPLCGN